jgi:nuclear cap-binding protein subunit 2
MVFCICRQEYHTAIEKSCCLYVGNLSYFTTEAQIYDFFNRAGEVKRVVMGLDKFQKTPCGFCFVEYYTIDDTEAAIRYLNGMKLDDRQVRLDRDPGFVEGRQYGRGKSGGQVRDEYRLDFDLGRGGFGKVYQVAGTQDLAAMQSATFMGRGGGGYLQREGRDRDGDDKRHRGRREGSEDADNRKCQSSCASRASCSCLSAPPSLPVAMLAFRCAMCGLRLARR